MKSMLKKWKKKNSGNSFVVVVVAVTFIGILAVALLSVTMMSYKRMAITRKNDSTYYVVESAADQLKTGIIDEANRALQTAYATLEPQMKYWDAEAGCYMLLSDSEANKRLKRYFITELYNQLCGNPSNPTLESKYAKLCTYVTAQKAALVDPAVAGGYLGSEYKFDVIPVIDEDNNVYKIQIKGLLFEANAGENDGYVQNLYTDFEITAPELNIKFNTNETDTEKFLDYAILAEDGFELNSGALVNTSTTYITGNMYAGVDWDENQITFDTAYSERYKDTSKVSSLNSGIYVSNANLTLQSNNLVTAGNIVADNASFIMIRSNDLTNNANQIWCRNMVTMASDENKKSSQLMISGVMNVYDDLELNAKESSVVLQGEYYGYNYGTFGGDADYAANSYNEHLESVNEQLKNTYGKHYNTSSILINGANSNLDMTQLTKLTVQGRTHIDMGEDTYVMGESISVKGNQLAYSVPNSLLTDVGGKIGVNELKLDELGDAGKAIERLLASNTNTVSYNVFPETDYSAENLKGRYFYRFVDDQVAMVLPWDESRGPVQLTATQKAEEYIKWYTLVENGYTDGDLITYDVTTGKYGTSQSSAKVFSVGSIKISDNGDYGKIYSNGAVMVKEETGASQGKMLSVEINSVDATLATTQSSKIRDYNFQLRYLRNAQPEDAALGAVASSPIVNYLNVIEDTAVSISNRQFTDAANRLATLCGDGPMHRTVGGDDQIMYSLYFKKGENIVINENFTGFIFTTENVYIGKDCKKISGLICAGGKVYVEDRTDNLTIDADSSVMRNLVQDGFDQDTATYLKQVFMYDTSGDDDDSQTTTIVDEDKNLRNYNCSNDIKTMNYQKNIVYVGTN